MPNWIKEEIKKAVITTSVDHLKEETQSNEDEGIDKSFGKADQADSKSVDSSRSTEEDDDDEVLFYLFCLVILRCLFILKKTPLLPPSLPPSLPLWFRVFFFFPLYNIVIGCTH